MVLESGEGTDLVAKVCEIFGPENTELTTKIHTSKSTNAASRDLALFFAEDTDTFSATEQFTGTIEWMSEKDSSNSHEVISDSSAP